MVGSTLNHNQGSDIGANAQFEPVIGGSAKQFKLSKFYLWCRFLSWCIILSTLHSMFFSPNSDIIKFTEIMESIFLKISSDK